MQKELKWLRKLKQNKQSQLKHQKQKNTMSCSSKKALDLNTLPTFQMKDLNEHFRAVIKHILPDLYDFKLHHDSKKFVNIDFYFENDPRRDEVGYAGFGLNDFVYGSPTSERLTTIIILIGYGLDIDMNDEQ